MDAEWIRWAVSGLMVVLMYFGKRTIDNNESSIKSLQKEVDDVKQNYLHKNDFKDFKLELRAMFLEFKQDIKESIHNGKG